MSRLGECQQRDGTCKLEIQDIQTKSRITQMKLGKELVNSKMGSLKLPKLKNNNSTNSCVMTFLLSILIDAAGIPKEERMGPA